MQNKPDFKKVPDALAWYRAKYKERETDLMGSMPTLEVFLMGVIEMLGYQAQASERLAKALESIEER